jgi:hypothetical protein
MGWQRDGSGLAVKRVRGMTLPQWVATTRWVSPDRSGDARWTRRQQGNGRLCHTETARRTFDRVTGAIR